MIKKIMLSAILAATVLGVSLVRAQQSPAAITLPSQISTALLLEHGSTIAVTEIPFKSWTVGKNSFTVEGLGGVNVTSSQSAVGTAAVLTHTFNPHISAGIGLGTTLDLNTLSFTKLSRNNTGLIFVLSIK